MSHTRRVICLLMLCIHTCLLPLYPGRWVHPQDFDRGGVGEWVLGHKIGPVHSLNGKGSIITTDSSSVLDLRIPLLDSGLVSSNIGSMSITASSGHVIMTQSSSSRAAGLVPPIEGSWSFRKALDWLQEKQGRATFVPR
ncbi:hypothetical protein BS47DRAFT_967518 [Hydnum rufescens UP504]|uniref:Uncharacterized protein n=1 Tax=Hydnum rufescens UP504 TaxID=1448309 RepID=A0A9P6AWY8_9AGAM|nr:hypothetical protein BS47DRAFT_967518 [Hydnum rufescens UP504]